AGAVTTVSFLVSSTKPGEQGQGKRKKEAGVRTPRGRRQTVLVLRILRAAVLPLLAFSLCPGTAVAAEPALPRYTLTEPHMGTRFKATLYAPAESTAAAAAKDALARVAARRAFFNAYRPAP